MEKVTIKIEGRSYQVTKGSTILEAAKECGFELPTLCFMKGLIEDASCRVCVVEVKGARSLVASCVYPVNEGMEILINSPKAVAVRRGNVELLLSNHSKECQTCDKNGRCELLRAAQITGARDHAFEGAKTPRSYDGLSASLVRDTSKCVLCGRCVKKCNQEQGIGILDFEKRGFNTIVTPAAQRSFAEVPCMLCGQCVSVCPTGALSVKSEIDLIDQAKAEGKYIIVQTAPAVRAALGEEFDLPVGTNVTGKMVAALKRLGFQRVFDTNFGADLTIMEEASELIHRIQNQGKLPMITSCSPGWVNYAEYYYGDLLEHLSTCKSPHQMLGAIAKSYFAEKNHLDPKDIFVVSIMPCSAKKHEKEREENAVNGLKDVDAVLTTHELGVLIKRSGIQFTSLPEETFDQDLLGEYSGAGVIFGVTGGVMEAAVRSAYKMLTGEERETIEFTPVRGFEGFKEATVLVNGIALRIAVVHGMNNARPLLEDIRKGKSPYAFIEVMGCPGGCINGGGQPCIKPMFMPNEGNDILETYRAKRASVLYKEDQSLSIRMSHLNTQVQDLYTNYLGNPNSHKAHELLHTHYHARIKFPYKDQKEI